MSAVAGVARVGALVFLCGLACVCRVCVVCALCGSVGRFLRVVPVVPVVGGRVRVVCVSGDPWDYTAMYQSVLVAVWPRCVSFLS